MTRQIALTINGEQQTLDLIDQRLVTVLEYLKIKPAGVVVDINGCLHQEAAFTDLTVKDHDILEIIHFIGGG